MTIGAQRGMISHLIKDVDLDEVTKGDMKANIGNDTLIEDEFDITKIIWCEENRQWLRNLNFVETPANWVVVTPSDDECGDIPINKISLDALKADKGYDISQKSMEFTAKTHDNYRDVLRKIKIPKDLYPTKSREECRIDSAKAKINAMNISASEKKRRIEQAIKQIKSSNKRR